MWGLTQSDVVEWSIQTTVALIGMASLIIVALINTRRNRRKTEQLKDQADVIDTHESHIQSLEDRVQTGERRFSQAVGILAMVVVWSVFAALRTLVEWTMERARKLKD